MVNTASRRAPGTDPQPRRRPTRTLLVLGVLLLLQSASTTTTAHTGQDLLTGSPRPQMDDAAHSRDPSPLPPLTYRLSPDGETGRIHISGAPSPIPLRTAADVAAEREAGGFRFVCPGNGVEEINTQPEEDTQIFYGCPIRIQDQNDDLGNLQLMVNPSDPRQQAFVSLHGAEGEGGPVDATRRGQTHTVFATYNGGVEWFDNPIAQGRTPDPSQVHGVNAAAVMDEDQMYIANHWALPRGDGTWATPIRLYKMASPQDAQTASDYVGNWGRYAELPVADVPVYIDRMGIAHVDAFDPDQLAEDRVSSGNGFGHDAGGDGAANETNRTEDERAAWGELAVPAASRPARVAVVWHARAMDDPDPETNHTMWIDAAITNTSAANTWHAIPAESRIGPCLNMTNPVGWRGQVYVGCVVAPGYDHRPRARVGDVDLWHIDPLSGASGLVSHTRIAGLQPQLAVTGDGYFAIINAERSGNTTVTGAAAFGWYGQTWEAMGTEVGVALHGLVGSGDVLDARVTALAMSERTRTAFLVYHEWQPPSADSSPGDGASVEQRSHDMRKVVVAFDRCDFAFAAAEFDLGVAALPSAQWPDAAPSQGTPLRTYANPGTYNDHKDGLVTYTDPDGRELLYFAINDFGIAQFGGIEPTYSDNPCVILPPVPPIIPAALPSAVGLSSGVTTTMGVTFGAIATSMVGYLLTVKRRQANSLAAEAR